MSAEKLLFYFIYSPVHRPSRFLPPNSFHITTFLPSSAWCVVWVSAFPLWEKGAGHDKPREASSISTGIAGGLWSSTFRISRDIVETAKVDKAVEST